MGKMIWFCVVVFLFLVGCVFICLDRIITSNDITLDVSEGSKFVITTNSSLTLEGASNDYFYLRSQAGQEIFGTKKEPPLGWDHDLYYTSDKVIITDGVWKVIKGYPTVRLQSEHPINVKIVSDDKFTLVGLLFFGIACIWIIGLYIADKLSD